VTLGPVSGLLLFFVREKAFVFSLSARRKKIPADLN